MVLNDIGTGKNSKLLLKEEPTWAGTITTATEVWLRYNDFKFGPNKEYIEPKWSGSRDIGTVKPTVELTRGSIDFDVDMTTLPWILKWLMGSISSTQVGASTEYKHVMKFGSGLKSFRAFANEGGLSVPLYYNSLGMVPESLTLAMKLTDVLTGVLTCIGKKKITGADPGTVVVTADNQLVGFNGFRVFKGTAGATSVATITTALTDIYDAEVILNQNLKADNYRSDGTGFSAGITDEVPSVGISMVGSLSILNNVADFEANTEIALALTFDTGLAVVGGTGNYRVEIIVPRCVLADYTRNIRGAGPIIPTIRVKPMMDNVAGYGIAINVYNAITTYANAT